MGISLDRETRKTLVSIAETDTSGYGLGARIILALATGKQEQQVSLAVRTSLNEVRLWRERFEAEGMAIFPAGERIDSFKASSAVPPNTTSDLEPSPADDFQASANADDDTFPTLEKGESSVRGRGRPASRRPLSRRVQKQRERRESRTQDRQGQIDSTQRSIEDAVAEGMEELLDELGDENLALEMPTRTVISQTSIVSSSEEDRPVYDGKKKETAQKERDEEGHATTANALATKFEIDMAHAQHISTLAREFFDATANLHKLPPNYRNLLHVAALLHNIAYKIDPENHHTVGRDMVLQHTLKDISLEERQMIAAMIGMHRLTPRPHHDIAYMNLPPELRMHTQTLTAILRIGIGLDYSHSQTSHIVNWHFDPGEMTLVIGGRENTIDAVRAHQNADLWNRLFSASQLRFITTEQASVADYVGGVTLSLDFSVTLKPLQASTQLRQHYATRFDYLATQLRESDANLLIPLWREFQRVIGIWSWLLPEAKPRKAFKEDTEWLTRTLYTTLQYTTLAERYQGILEETNPDHDDPQAIQSLRSVCLHYAKLSTEATQYLRETLASRRYERWIDALKDESETEADTSPLPFAARIAPHAWACLAEMRQIIETAKMTPRTEALDTILPVKTVHTFEMYCRRLSDLLIYSAAVLGTEYEQTLDMLDPVLEFTRAWQRLELVAQHTYNDWQKTAQRSAESVDGGMLALQALATIIRARADAMRFKLLDMWQPLDTPTFRRALALAIANP